MESTALSDAKRRVLDQLKRSGPDTVPALASALGLTQPAVRQHLRALKEHGLAEPARGTPNGRGRPAVRWTLTELAHELFPDRHADLTLELLEAMRAAIGERGVEAVIAARAGQQIDAYRASIGRGAKGAGQSLRGRVEALADRRTREGYMAEVAPDPDAPEGCLLIEHHCPICEAAAACQGLCAAELDVFRAALGPDASVERVEHLLTQGDRCVYRIRPAG